LFDDASHPAYIGAMVSAKDADEPAVGEENNSVFPAFGLLSWLQAKTSSHKWSKDC